MTTQPEVGLTGRAPVSPCDYYIVKEFASGVEGFAGRFELVTAGKNGAWACGIFSKVKQGATKNIDGYLCAAEFELDNAAPNASAMSAITLNWINSSDTPGAPGGSTQAYIQLRDYSTGTPCSNLFEFTDVTKGDAATVLITDFAVTNVNQITQGIKFTVKNTPYWILCAADFA